MINRIDYEHIDMDIFSRKEKIKIPLYIYFFSAFAKWDWMGCGALFPCPERTKAIRKHRVPLASLDAF